MIEIEFKMNSQFNLVKQTHGANLDAADDFARAIKPYTYASILRVAFAHDRMINLADTRAPVKPSNIYNYAKIFVRNLATGDLNAIILPAPIMSLFELKGKDENHLSYQVKPSSGAQFAEIYSALAGEPFTFAHGALAGSAIDRDAE